LTRCPAAHKIGPDARRSIPRGGIVANRTKSGSRPARNAAGRPAPRRTEAPAPSRQADSPARADMRAATPDLIQSLHPLIGNHAVQRMMRIAVDARTSLVARDLVQREEAKGKEKKPKKTKKAMIEKAKSVTVLQDAYKDYVKKIKGGKVEVLGQADFEKAWEKIYGKTKYAWDKYIKPNEGNLEGFAYKGVNYINKDIGSVDVVPHEMLHNNTSASWTPFAGSELDEGTTEYLTIKAVKAAKYTPSHSYPDQEGVVRELVKVTSEDLLMKAYFKGQTAKLKKEMESNCRGTWAQFKKAMQAEKWTKAKGYLKPPKKEKKSK
jgi:hypothetical protein